MLSSSTQKKYWIFDSAVELQQLRFETNDRFIKSKRAHIKESVTNDFFLTPFEEHQLFRQFENILRDFCRKFTPSMPRSVVATALTYYKRFYLNNSVMDHHPKQILVTSVYLACKVEEFNISMNQFVENVKGDRERAASLILSNELLLMQQLKYHLTVHNPYRPIEGFLIHFKTHMKGMQDSDKFRTEIEALVEKIYFTDAILLFAPSQIGLAVVVEIAQRNGLNAIEDYVNATFFKNDQTLVNRFWEKKSTMIKMAHELSTPSKEIVRAIEKKLEACRNQANNPDSKEYQGSMPIDSSQGSSGTYVSLSQEQAKHEIEQIAANAQRKR